MKIRTAVYEMNDILKDKVSGFKGSVQAISFYATGCTHYGLAPLKVKTDGAIGTWEWLDESRLELVKKAPSEEIKKPVSGPDRNPKCK